MMKKIFHIVIVFLFITCDPMDDRLSFQNNTADDIFIKCFFIRNKEMYGTWVGLRPIAQKESKVIGIIGTWENMFKQLEPMEPMFVVVYKNYNYLADPVEHSTNIKSDSLLRVGDYKYKKYSYQELMSRKWKIVYPDDGFEEGIPLEIE